MRRSGPAAWLIHAAFVASSLASSHSASAQTTTVTSPRDTARELANGAADAIARGDYAQGEAMLAQAYEVYPAPTIAVLHARTLVFLGRLTDGVAAYQRATLATLGPDAPEAFRSAVASAKTELAELRPRVPRLQVLVRERGDGTGQSRLELDGKPVPSTQLGRWILADPGRRRVRVEWNGTSYERSVRLEERQSVVIELAEPPSSSLARWATVGALGVGVISVGAGAISGIIAASAHGQARERCPDWRCTAGSEGARALERYRDLRVVSTISYAIGGVGIALGGVLLLRGSFDEPTLRVELETPSAAPVAMQQ
jgi:hypothetical protein